MERKCFNCAHRNDNAWHFRCAECAADDYFLWMGKKQTNADKIRQMSDEELAEYLNNELDACCGKPCDWNDPSTDCDTCWLDWLKQEVESDG